MNLLYLLWVMWTPPHLFSISVGVWCRVSATIDAFSSRLGSGKTTEAAEQVSPHTSGRRRQHTRPECVS